MSEAAAIEEEEDGPRADRPMTLGAHLDELRRRLIRSVLYVLAGSALALVFEGELTGFILFPYWEVLHLLPGAGFQVTEVSEAFFTRMWLAIVVGLFVAGPFVLLEVWGFISKGLYDRERRWVRIFAPISLFLFVEGVVFYYYVVQPGTLAFLLPYGVDVPMLGGTVVEHVAVQLRLETTVRFYLVMSLVMGLTFQFPLGMIFAQKLGIATWRTYVKYWRHFFLGSMVAMAILTPSPDAATLGVCMVPVLFLFAAGIVVCWILEPNAAKEQDAS